MNDGIFQQAKILIVDDEAMAADFLQLILKKEGYRRIERLLNPLEAIAAYHRLQPDLVILDWVMPKLTGAKLLQQLRAEIAPESYLPILIVTALPDLEIKKEAFGCGATDFLTKPFDSSEIVLRVGNLLATRFLHLQLQVRNMQQAAVAKLGELGLGGGELQRVFDEAVVLVAETLDVEFSKLLELLPGGASLLMRAGVGWKRGIVGHSTGDAGRGSQCGYTLLADAPVILEDLRTEERFVPTPLLLEHGVVSGISVVIRTSTGPFGVLGAHTRAQRKFSSNDINFLQAVANVVGAAVSRHAVEQTLRDAKEEAERANAAKSEFLSRMSHELRTPLNAILGFAQLAELDVKTPDDRENVDQIMRAGAHLLQLINEALDIARIEEGRMAVTIEPVSLHRVLTAAITLIQPLSTEREVTINDASCYLHVLADEQRLQQILLNLFSNAIKYNRKGGTVSITCAETSGGRKLRLTMEDTGIGIDAINLPKLFQPFQRLQTSDAMVEGIGLGLTISHRLIGLMGGTMGAESTKGVGSRFWFELPLSPAPVEAAFDEQPPKVAPRPGGESTPRTLLYIEDDPANLKLVERILVQRPAIRMIAAQQGSMGLEMARQHLPHLILLDLHLPDMNGDQVLVTLRSKPRTAHIPVVVISADAIGGEIERLKQLGACAYVTKPFEVPKLLSVLDEVLASVSQRLSAR